MKAPAGFRELCQCLHQDALYIAQDSIERMASECVLFVSEHHKAELGEFLRRALRETTSEELKDEIDRQEPDIDLPPDEAKLFLEHVLRNLA